MMKPIAKLSAALTPTVARLMSPCSGAVPAHTVPLTPVACSSCHACCQGHQLVVLQPDEDGALLSIREVQTSQGNLRALQHKPNGDCMHLGEDGCMVHAFKPMMCRIFDCAEYARRWPRARRRRLGMPMSPVLAEGQRRLREATHGG